MRGTRREKQDAAGDRGGTQIPQIFLPKGGGAIRGIGKKFAVNPVTVSSLMTVPMATLPGRARFGPRPVLSSRSLAARLVCVSVRLRTPWYSSKGGRNKVSDSLYGLPGVASVKEWKGVSLPKMTINLNPNSEEMSDGRRSARRSAAFRPLQHSHGLVRADIAGFRAVKRPEVRAPGFPVTGSASAFGRKTPRNQKNHFSCKVGATLCIGRECGTAIHVPPAVSPVGARWGRRSLSNVDSQHPHAAVARLRGRRSNSPQPPVWPLFSTSVWRQTANAPIRHRGCLSVRSDPA